MDLVEGCGGLFVDSVPFMRPPVFDGENYLTWAVKMSAFLKGEDLWEAVETDYKVTPLPKDPTIYEREIFKLRTAKDAKARSFLYSSVSPEIFNKISTLDSAKAIWDRLESEYKGDGNAVFFKVLRLLRKFDREQMRDIESVKEYTDRLVDIAREIRLLGTDFEDERIVLKIMMSLPEKFEPTILAFEMTRALSEIKVTELVGALQRLELRSLMRRREPSDGMKHGTWGSCRHCGKKNHPHYKCWRKPDLECWFCGRLGHAQIICKEMKACRT